MKTPEELKIDRQMYQLHKKGYEEIAGAITDLKDGETKDSVQKVELVAPDNTELANVFFSMLRGKDGHTPTKEELVPIIEELIPEPIPGPQGIPGESIKGDSYVLTEEDKKEIASNIKPKIVEKVIEKTIVEKPIVTQVVKEVAKYQTARQLVNELISLKEAWLPIDAIVGDFNSKVRGLRSGGVNSLGSLIDVDLSGLSKTADGRYILGSGGSGSGTVGPGTINEIAYFNSTTTVASLAVATYPSLTELSYVKGVTSPVQTQLNAKQNTITTGTTSQYFRGDLSLATFPTALSSFTNDTSYITASSLTGLVPYTGATSNLALGTNSITMTGSIGVTGSRVTKLWATDITITNAPTFDFMTQDSILFAGASGVLAQDNSNFVWDNTNKTIGIGTGASSTNKFTLADTVLAGSGALAGSLINLTQTWNTSGTPTAIKLNVTDTASNASSLLMDLRVGGVSQFSVSKTGAVSTSANITANSFLGSTSIRAGATGAFYFNGRSQIKSPSDGMVYLRDSTDATYSDLTIKDGTARSITLADTVLAGSGSLAGSVFSATQTWNTSGSPTAIKLNITNTASGASSLFLDFQIAGTSYFKVAKDGSVTTNNAGINIGTGAFTTTGNVSGNSWLGLTLVRSGATSGFQWNGRSIMKSSADGSIEFYKADQTTFSGLQTLYERWGTGTPESAVTAPVGAIYHRTDGGAGTSLYVKESGSGNTGWVAK